MSHLSELSVLNLAGNNIARVENLRGLDCLTELNLRHNHISAVVSEQYSALFQRTGQSECSHFLPKVKLLSMQRLLNYCCAGVS